MKNSKELLSSLLKTTQMGQVGIRSILDISMCPGLRKALEYQLQEYDAIESEAYAIASQRGWELTDLDPAVRFFSDMLTRMRLTRSNCDSKIADMIILGNTRGMVKGLRHIHKIPDPDNQISTICQKLLDCETANIRQMQGFL